MIRRCEQRDRKDCHSDPVWQPDFRGRSSLVVHCHYRAKNKWVRKTNGRAAILRSARPVKPGLVYHVIDPEEQSAEGLRTQADDAVFLKALAELKDPMRFELYGYCLHDKHFHCPCAVDSHRYAVLPTYCRVRESNGSASSTSLAKTTYRPARPGPPGSCISGLVCYGCVFSAPQ